MLAMGLLVWLWVKEKQGAAKLGGAMDTGGGFLLAGSLLGVIFSPWQFIALEGAVFLWGSVALAYAMAQRLRDIPAERLLGKARGVAFIFAGVCVWAFVRGEATLVVWALGALCWGTALCMADKKAWKFLWLAVCLGALVFLGMAGKGLALAGGLVFAVGSLYAARKKGWLSRKQVSAVGFAACAGVWAIVAAVQMSPEQERAAFAGVFEKHAVSSLRAGWLLGNERPLTGWGLGTGTLLYPKIAAQTITAPDSVADLGNTPMQLLAEMGVWGILGVILILWGVTRRWNVFLSMKDLPVDGRFVCATGSVLFLLAMAGAALAGQPFANRAVWLVCGAMLGVFAGACPPEKGARFAQKARPMGILLWLGLLGASGYCLWNGWCQQERPTDDFRVINQRVRALAQSGPRDAATFKMIALGYGRSLEANPYQPDIWLALAQMATMTDDWTAAQTAADRAYRLAPNIEGALPLLAAVAAKRGQANNVAVLLALEILNDPAFLLKDTAMQESPAASTVAEVADGLYGQLESDLPQYAQRIAYARAFLAWTTDGADVAPEIAPTNAQAFWHAVAVMRAGEIPGLPPDAGWACLLRLWEQPEKRGQILDAWYAAHPHLPHPAEKRARLLACFEKAKKLPDLLRPIDGQENPLWEDLQLDGIFPARGFLPPAVRLPLYEGLVKP